MDENIQSTSPEFNESDSGDIEYYLTLNHIELESSSSSSSNVISSFPSGIKNRRLRYTCSDISPNVTPILDSPKRFIALGTTSGSVHVFQLIDNNIQQQSLQHLTTIIHEELISSVTSVQFAPIQLVVNSNIERYDHIKHDSNNSSSSESMFHDSYSSGNSSTDAGIGSGFDPTPPPPPPPPPSSQHPHQLMNLQIAIGTVKGNLLVVDINLNTNNGIRRVKIPGLMSQNGSKSIWTTMYHSKLITTNPITILRWNQSNRLYIGDQMGKLFILHEIDEMKRLMLSSIPTLLLDLNGIQIQQMDLIGEQWIILSTNDNRIFMFNQHDSTMTQIGRTGKIRRNQSTQFNGICSLEQYRLIELNRFHYDDSDSENDEEDAEDETNVTKAFRLASVETCLYATRPKCRLWSIDVLQASVRFTHQFEQLVLEEQPSIVEIIDQRKTNQYKSIFLTNYQDVDDDDDDDQSLMINNKQFLNQFGRLEPMYWRNMNLEVTSYLVTYSPMEPCRIFVLDPNRKRIVASTPLIDGQILQLKCIGNDIFITIRRANLDFQMFILTLRIIEHEDHNIMENEPTSFISDTSSSSSSFRNDETEEEEKNDKEEKEEETIEKPEPESKMNQAIRLFDELYGIEEIIIPVNKCQCGLPLEDETNCFDPNEMETLTKILKTNNNDHEICYNLLELAYHNGRWQMFMFLLAQLNECKLYLYFALLLNHHSCWIRCHWDLFASNNMESIWEDIFDYIGQTIFNGKPATTTITNGLVAFQFTNTKMDSISIKLFNENELKCNLCRLKMDADEKRYHSIVIWFQDRLLRHCLWYCSPSFVKRMLITIVEQFNKRKQQSSTNHNCTQLFTINFYLLLLRFVTMKISLETTNVETILKRIETTKIGNKLSSTIENVPIMVPMSRRLMTPNDNINNCKPRIVDFTKSICDKCHQTIVPKNSHTQIRRSIKLYRSCQHIFHSTCTGFTMKRCPICNFT